MNAIVVSYSKFGNTRRVAETVAETLNMNGSVQLIDTAQLVGTDFSGVDLLVMGSPTHNMNLPKAVRPIFDELPRRTLKGVHVAAFDTSYEMSWILNQFTAAKRLINKLRKLGGRKIVPPETFIVISREGPLRDGELERARQWAHTILASMDGRRDQS